jgi:hypothetical protein
MRRLFIAILYLPLGVLAQPTDIPKSATDALARDLAQLQQTVVSLQEQQNFQNLPGVIGKVAFVSAAELKAGATDSAPTLVQAAQGTILPVVAQRPGWVAVRTEQPYKGVQTFWVRESSTIPVASAYANTTTADRLFETLTEQAARFKQAYETNPYVSVTGFVVNLVPPSISINFDFKKK